MEPVNARDHREGGQMLVLFVLALGVLMGFVAMTVDVGMILHERRSLQNGADAAALAGVQELPESPSVAIAKALEYAAKHGFAAESGATITVNTPYQGNPGKIEVVIEEEMPFVFARVLGLESTGVSARAVAQVTSGEAYSGSGDAIFVINNDCGTFDALTIAGSENVVIGSVHSNSVATTSGSDNLFDGSFTFNCGFDNTGQNNTYTSSPTQVGYLPPPLNYTYSDFACNYTYSGDTVLKSQPEVWLDPERTQLKPGVYCSQQDISLSGHAISGNVTLVAKDEVKVSGSDFDLTAFFGGVLAFSGASHNGAIDMSGSGGGWVGLLHAPDGQVKVQGSDNLSVTGSIVADRAKISGSNFTLNAQALDDDDFEFPALIRLIE